MASAIRVREMRETLDVWEVRIFGVGMMCLIGRCALWLVAAGANAGAIKAGDFALSCAGIIQIRYEGYFSPGNNCFQDP